MKRDKGAAPDWKQTVWDSFPGSIIITDSELNIQWVNPHMLELSGYDSKQLIDTNLAAIFSPGDSETDRVDAAFFKKNTKNDSVVVKLKNADGKSPTLLLTRTELNGIKEKATGILFFGYDISSLKEKENYILQQLESAQAASHLKSEFIANMSHELRNPLNSVIGFSDVLLNSLPGPLNEQQSTFVRHILESGNQLLNLVNQIIELAKIATDDIQLEIDSIPIEELVQDTLYFFLGKIQKQRLNIRKEFDSGLTEICADEQRLKQVLYILVANAIRHTEDGGYITISTRKTEKTENNKRTEYFEISVADTGRGIPAELQQTLFNPFPQGESPTIKHYEGIGLGLNIAREYVHLHGGDIRFQSQDGKGSVFIFTIPVKSSDLQGRIE